MIIKSKFKLFLSFVFISVVSAGLIPTMAYAMSEELSGAFKEHMSYVGELNFDAAHYLPVPDKGISVVQEAELNDIQAPPVIGRIPKRFRDAEVNAWQSSKKRAHVETPVSCEVCNREFNQKGDLKVHMLIHTGERLFACSQCNLSFVHRGNLNAHMRKHTGEKPFKCPLCDLACTQEGNLKRHMKRKHPVKQENQKNLF